MFRLAVFSVLATAAFAWSVKGYDGGLTTSSISYGSPSLLGYWGAPTYSYVAGQPQYSSYSLGHLGGAYSSDLALGGVSSYHVAAPVSERYSTVEYVNLQPTRKVINIPTVSKTFVQPVVAAPVSTISYSAAPAVSTISTSAPAVTTEEISAPVAEISSGFPVQEKEWKRK